MFNRVIAIMMTLVFSFNLAAATFAAESNHPFVYDFEKDQEEIVDLEKAQAKKVNRRIGGGLIIGGIIGFMGCGVLAAACGCIGACFPIACVGMIVGAVIGGGLFSGPVDKEKYEKEKDNVRLDSAEGAYKHEVAANTMDDSFDWKSKGEEAVEARGDLAQMHKSVRERYQEAINNMNSEESNGRMSVEDYERFKRLKQVIDEERQSKWSKHFGVNPAVGQ